MTSLHKQEYNQHFFFYKDRLIICLIWSQELHGEMYFDLRNLNCLKRRQSVCTGHLGQFWTCLSFRFQLYPIFNFLHSHSLLRPCVSKVAILWLHKFPNICQYSPSDCSKNCKLLWCGLVLCWLPCLLPSCVLQCSGKYFRTISTEYCLMKCVFRLIL